MSTGYVYFVRQGSDGPVKIGYSDSPHQQISDLQEASPHQLELLGITEGGLTLESTLHKALMPHHLRGQWFDCTDEVLAAILSLPDVSPELGLSGYGYTRTEELVETYTKGAMGSLAKAAFAGLDPAVFAVQVEGNGPIYIGFTWTLQHSLQSIRSACPHKLELLTAIDAGSGVADAVCERLQADCLHGQWFRPSLDVDLQLHFLPDTARALDYPGTFYGGVAIRRPDPELLHESLQGAAQELSFAYLRMYAPVATVVHYESGSMMPRLHLTATEAKKHGKAEIERTRPRVAAVCFYRRDLDPRAQDAGLWAYVSAAGVCPGGCRPQLM